MVEVLLIPSQGVIQKLSVSPVYSGLLYSGLLWEVQWSRVNERLTGDECLAVFLSLSAVPISLICVT